MKQVTIIIMWCLFAHMQAQDNVRIYYKNRAHIDIPITEIDSLTFADSDTVSIVDAELTGSWLWGSAEKGYYELLSFNKDHTYTAYDNYFTYGFDTTTYGFYSQYITMLTLWSNGFGYQHRYNWYITGLSPNALSVMTKMGPFTYYRMQHEVIKLKVGEKLNIKDEETCVFVDGVIVLLEDNQLIGNAHGETYILKMITQTKIIWAYKLMVE